AARAGLAEQRQDEIRGAAGLDLLQRLAADVPPGVVGARARVDDAAGEAEAEQAEAEQEGNGQRGLHRGEIRRGTSPAVRLRRHPSGCFHARAVVEISPPGRRNPARPGSSLQLWTNTTAPC